VGEPGSGVPLGDNVSPGVPVGAALGVAVPPEAVDEATGPGDGLSDATLHAAIDTATSSTAAQLSRRPCLPCLE
jgi:hypothetical protein